MSSQKVNTKLCNINANAKAASGQFTAQLRVAGYAGLVWIWLFYGESASVFKNASCLMRLAGSLLLSSLALDLIQFYVGACYHRIVYVRLIKSGVGDDSGVPPPNQDWIDFIFYLKGISLILGYVVLIFGTIKA